MYTMKMYEIRSLSVYFLRMAAPRMLVCLWDG